MKWVIAYLAMGGLVANALALETYRQCSTITEGGDYMLIVIVWPIMVDALHGAKFDCAKVGTTK